MKDFQLREFVDFKALEVDCSNCSNLCSLKNSECLNCINDSGLSFNLLELRNDDSSTVYYKNGLSDSLQGYALSVPEPLVIPSFLNYYLIDLQGEVIEEGSEFKIVEKDGVKFLVLNPVEYDLTSEELEGFMRGVRKVQDEELSVDDLRISDEVKELVECYTSGLGVVSKLLKIKGVQDVYLNSPGDSCLFFNHEEFGQLSSNIYFKKELVNKISTYLRTTSGRPFDEAFPVIHTNLKSVVSRVCGVTQPMSFKGSGFAIRKHSFNPFTLTKLVNSNFLSSQVAGLVWFLLDSDVSILITGPRGSGKTTFLGSLLFQLDKSSRFIIIEDTKELPVKDLKRLGFNVEHLRTTSFSQSEGFEFTSDAALKTALRLGESVLVVGEVRGEEARTLFEGMRIGAAGNSVLGTIHGSGAFDTFDRIVHDLNVPPTSFKATDVVMSCAYLKKRGGEERKLVNITEVGKEWVENPRDEDGFNELVSYNPMKDEYEFSDLEDSDLIKSIAYNKGLKLEEVVEEVELRSGVIEFVKGLDEEGGFSSPKRSVEMNLLFDKVLRNEITLSDFKKRFLNRVEEGGSTDSTQGLILKTLSNLSAVGEENCISTQVLYEELRGELTRSTFNKELNELEVNGLVESVTTGRVRNWFLSD